MKVVGFDAERQMNKPARITAIGVICFVIGIAGMALVFLPAGTPQADKAKREYVHASIKNITTACDMFNIDCGRYPTEQEGLGALVRNPGIDGWRGPYIGGENGLPDPWGTPLRLASHTGKVCRVLSAGPDKLFGSRDDIQEE